MIACTLHRLLGDGNLTSEKVCGEEYIICTGPAEAAKAGQKSTVLYWHGEPDEPAKDGPLSYVLQESPFASDSTVTSRDHPSVVSLVTSNSKNCKKSKDVKSRKNANISYFVIYSGTAGKPTTGPKRCPLYRF
jgi:hypothetical protein